MTTRPALGSGAVVTGAGSGIGRASALRLAGEGMAVAALGRSLPAVEETTVAVQALGGQAHPLSVDVRRPEEVRRAVKEAAAWLGGTISLLVNAAGIYREGPFDQISDTVIDELVDTDLKGAVHVSRAALEWMPPGGCIINVGSMSGVRALPQQALYAAAKAGLIHLGACLAKELADRQIRVNTLSPGPTNTNVLRTIMPEPDIPAVQDALRALIPLGRLAEPEEIADAICHLARTPFATGAHLVLDGGITL